MGIFKYLKNKRDKRAIAAGGCYVCGSYGLDPNDLGVCLDCGIAFCRAHSGSGPGMLRIYCPKCGQSARYAYP